VLDEREELKLALQRIRSTDDGYLLFVWLQKQIDDCLAPNASDGALREQHGRRNFARELMVMSQGTVNATAERAADSGQRSDAGPRAVGFGRARGVTRRVGAEPESQS
jgi:hypothetical protein